MKQLSCKCARCGAALRIPVDALLVAMTGGSSDPACLAYVCPSCESFVDETLPLTGLLTLLAAGCAPLVVTRDGQRG